MEIALLGALIALLPVDVGLAEEVFGPNLRVNHAGDGYYQNAPAVAPVPSGSLYVAWEDWRDVSGGIYLSRSRDGGASFDVERRVDPESAPGYGDPMLIQWPCMAVDGQGTIYVAWVAWLQGQTGRVWCARSLDGGESFEPPVLVSDSTAGDRAWPAIAGGPEGGVWVVWCDHRNGPTVVDLYVSCSEDGTMFTPNVQANLAPVGPTCTPPLPDIAIDTDSGVVHLVWRQTFRDVERHVYACRSLDGGATWQPAVEVSHDVWIFDG